MKRLLSIALISCAIASAEAPKRSGHAAAQWLVSGSPVEAGQSLKTVIRLEVDEPWHVYWYNPGEAGMPTTVEMEMPEGWKSSGLLHPIPKKFKTGELHGFGHEGTVDYVLELFAPENFKGDAEFVAKLAWLTCNNDACIPGEITLKLKLVDGKPVEASEDAAACAIAYGNLPVRAARNVKLILEDGKDHWKLSLVNIDAYKLDPDKTTVLVATQELVPSTAEVKFKRVGERWEAKAPKGEFAPQKPGECAILLVEEGKPAVRLEWKAE